MKYSEYTHMSNQGQTIRDSAAASVAEVEYLLAQFWAFRRVLSQARVQRAAFHPEDKLLTACVLEALQRDIILGLCRLEDDKSREGLRSCKDEVRRKYGQTTAEEFQRAISSFNDALRLHDIKQAHRNRYIAHLNLPAAEQPKAGPMEMEIMGLLNQVSDILKSIDCAPNSTHQIEAFAIDLSLTANAAICDMEGTIGSQR